MAQKTKNEVQHHKYALEDEILHLDNALQINITKNSVGRWREPEISRTQAEIDYLAQEGTQASLEIHPRT